MKKTLSIALIATIMVVALVVALSAILVSGAPVGTAVTNATEFAAMAADGQYYLSADITLSATYETEFTGTFDGNGHKVTTTVPMFSTVSGTVKNLTVEGTVDYSAITGNIGAVARAAKGATFADVTNKAAVSGYIKNYLDGETVYMSTAGGVVGLVTGNSSFTNVKNEGAINGYNVGGVVGMMGTTIDGSSTFTGCSNSGTITSNGVVLITSSSDPLYLNPKGNYLASGGIVGLIYEHGSVSFTNCSNSGVIDHTNAGLSKNSPAGGIYGFASYNTLTAAEAIPAMAVSLSNCTNTGAITGDNQTGGLVGWMGYVTFTANNCTNSGAVVSLKNYSGGLFGRAAETAYSVVGCINQATGTVATASSQCGGIIGYSLPALSAEIRDCTNYADLSTTNASINIGGMVGSSGNSTTDSFVIENCKNEGNLTATKYAAGIIANSGVKAHVYITNCINKGNITGADYTGGIVSSINSNPNFTVSGCINEGDIITTKNSCGGIVGFLSQRGGLLSNCINRGDVTGPAQIGGIVGYAQQSLDIEDCLNDEGVTISGDLTNASGYAAGIISRIGSDTLNEDVSTIKNCINKGDVVSAKDQAAGFVAYARRAVIFENCYNYGDITAPLKTAGIAANVKDYYSDYKNCFNYGNLTSTDENTSATSAGITAYGGGDAVFTHMYTFENCGNEGNIDAYGYVGGIVGYLYGAETKTVSIKYCYNTGNLTSRSTYVAGLLGYVNNVDNPICQYNYVSGTLTAAEGSYTYATIYNNAAAPSETTKNHHNFVVSGAADYLCFKNDLTNVEFPADYSFYYEADDLASGKLAYTLNTAIGNDLFYQTIGTDAYPVMDATHEIVKFNGTDYYNGADQETTVIEETTETPVTTVAPETTVQEPDDSTTEAEIETSSCGGCAEGSIIIAISQFIFVVGGAVTLVIVKKK